MTLIPDQPADSSSSLASVLEDATEYAKGLVSAEREGLKHEDAFLTWVVGLGSGAFLLYLNQLRGLADIAVAGRLDAVIAAAFFASLLGALVFKLTFRSQLRDLALDDFTAMYQRTHLRLNPAALVAYASPEKLPELATKLLAKLLLPDKALTGWLAARTRHSSVEQTGKWSYRISVFAFVIQYAATAVLLGRAFLKW